MANGFARGFDKTFATGLQLGAASAEKKLAQIAKEKEKTLELKKDLKVQEDIADFAVSSGLIDESLRDDLATVPATQGVGLIKAMQTGKPDSGDLLIAKALGLNVDEVFGKAKDIGKASGSGTASEIPKEPERTGGLIEDADLMLESVTAGGIKTVSRKTLEKKADIDVTKAVDTQEAKVAAERKRDFPRVDYKLKLLNRRSASGYKQMVDDVSNATGGAVQLTPGRGLDAIAAKAGLKVAQLAGYGEYVSSGIGLTTEIGTSLMRLSIKARSGQLAERFMKSIRPFSGNPYKDITMLADSWVNAYGEELVASGLRGQELEDELISAHINMFAKLSSDYVDQGVIDKPLSGGFTETEIIKYYKPTKREQELVELNLAEYRKTNPELTEEDVKRAMYQKGLYFGGRI